MNGSHRQHGVIILSGKDIKPQRVEAEMADIAPTLLYILEEPIPSYMEGRVLDVLNRSKALRRVEYRPSKQQDKSNSSEEHEAIRQRLEQLGYL